MTNAIGSAGAAGTVGRMEHLVTVDRVALAARIEAHATRFGSARKLAAAAGMNEKNLSVVIRRLRTIPNCPIELNTLEPIALAAGVPLAEFLGLAPPPGVAVGDLPGWLDAEKEARRARPLDPEHVWAAVRAVRLPSPAKPTPQAAASLAAAWVAMHSG